MKKLIALALAVMMVLALSACGSNVDTAALDEILTTVQALQEQVEALAAAAPAEAAPAPAADEAPAEEAPAAEPAGELAPKDGGTSLNLSTGSDTGTYYAFGGVMAQKVSEVTSTSVTAITSGGSKANIEALEMGDAELGFVQSDVMAYGYAGTRLFEETGAVENFSTVAAMYMEQVQIVTLNPDIQSVSDLEGKNVSIGAAGSGVYFNAIDILGVYGLTEEDINPTYQNFGDSVEALQDGQIDAAFIVAGAPTNAVTSLAATNDVYLVSLDAEHIAELVALSPYYTEYTISADTYGMPEDATTVAVGAVIIARDDVSDADVYNFLYGVFENLDNLGHDKAKEVSLEFATSVTDVPYHPGAAAYFADKGIDVPVK